MRNAGLLFLFVIGGVFVWALMKPTQASANVVNLLGIGSQPGLSDQAIEARVTSGNAWYSYWKNVLNGEYQRVGNMPIEGPLTTCITAPCPGTPWPQSP